MEVRLDSWTESGHSIPFHDSMERGAITWQSLVSTSRISTVSISIADSILQNFDSLDYWTDEPINSTKENYLIDDFRHSINMTTSEGFDPIGEEWINVAKKRWKGPGIINVEVNILQSYEMGVSNSENVILIDKRSSAKKYKRIGYIFLVPAMLVALTSTVDLLKSKGEGWKGMDYFGATLVLLLFILLAILFFAISKGPHFRLTRNNDELRIKKWLSHKSNSITHSTKRASLHLYGVDLEKSTTSQLIGDGRTLPGGHKIALMEKKNLALVYWVDGKQELFGLDPKTIIHYDKIDDFIEEFVGRT
jgi:hypothetical protein